MANNFTEFGVLFFNYFGIDIMLTGGAQCRAVLISNIGTHLHFKSLFWKKYFAIQAVALESIERLLENNIYIFEFL